MNDNHSPSYLYLHDEAKKACGKQSDLSGRGDLIIRFDTLIAKLKDGREEIFTAYGDGAHVRNIAFKNADGKFYTLDNALHNMQVENILNDAQELTAILDGKISYRFPAAVA